MAAFGVGSGQGLSAPIVYAYGILFVAYLGGLGGIIAGALGLIGAIFRIAVLGRRSASAAADAEPAACARAGSFIRRGSRRLLWPWLAGVPTLLLVAMALVGGVYVRGVVDREPATAAEAAQSDDPYWQWDDLLAHRERVPDAENAALVVDEVLGQLPDWWLRSTKPHSGEDGVRIGQVNEDLAKLQAIPANVRLGEALAESLRAELATYEDAVELARQSRGLPPRPPRSATREGCAGNAFAPDAGSARGGTTAGARRGDASDGWRLRRRT